MVEQMCEWFARCGRTATGTTPHPILGEVPTCDRCAEFARREDHTVQSDEDAVRASENLAELMRNAGVVELPDGSGWYGSSWERHDPEQQP